MEDIIFSRDWWVTLATHGIGGTTFPPAMGPSSDGLLPKDASFDGPHCLSFKVITPRSISASHALELASEVLNAHCASQAGLRDMLRGMPICASQALRLARPANRPVNGIGCTAERCDPVSRLAMVAGFVRIGFKLVQLRRTTTLTPSQNFCQILLCHFLSKHALKR